MHELTEFPLPTTNARPLGITIDRLGNIWFTTGSLLLGGPAGPIEESVELIGRLNSDFEIKEFPVPTPPSQPLSITLGPDGNLWFTEPEGNAIGRITPAGVITEIPLLSPAARPGFIASGADGNLWFTQLLTARGLDSSAQVARITPAGAIDEFDVEGSAYSLGHHRRPGRKHVVQRRGAHRPRRDSMGRDHLPRARSSNRHHRRPGRGTVVHQQRRTTRSAASPLPENSACDPNGGPAASPLLITRGPEDNLWFTDLTGGIWRINQAGTVDRILGTETIRRTRPHRRARRWDLVHTAGGAQDRPAGRAGLRVPSFG